MERGEATTVEAVETTRERNGKAPLLGAVRTRAGGRKPGAPVFDLILRVFAAGAAMASSIAMGTSEQTLPFTSRFFQFNASYDDLEAFAFFVIAFGVVAGYLALSIPFSIYCIARPTAAGPRIFLVLCDILNLAFATSSAAAATAIVYLAHNGNASTNWLAVCPQYPDFCRLVSGAVVGSFITVALLVCLVLVSTFALKKH